MTTVTVVRKTARAMPPTHADQMGSAKESAAYVTNHEKILQLGNSYTL
jgi:hypothetical protein